MHHVVELINQEAVCYVLQEVAALLYGDGAMGVVNIILEHCVAALQAPSNEYGINKFLPCRAKLLKSCGILLKLRT